MLIKILLIIIILAALIIPIVFFQREKIKNEEMYTKARNIIKDEALDNALKNPFLQNVNINIDEYRTMINFTVLKSKPKQSYVFDPKQIIGIGRSSTQNKIVINDATISQEQCKIILQGNEVLLVDCNSQNGTIVKRKLHSFLIYGGASITLKNGDVIILGSVSMRIKIFYFDVI